jgi:ribosomal protein S12 methylthiotransferase
MEGQLPLKVKQTRYKKAMKLQQRIAREVSESQVGKKIRVLVEKPLMARTHADAPDVDAQVILKSPASVGKFIEVQVTGTQVYDLVAEPV